MTKWASIIDPAQNNVRPELVEGHSAWGFDKLGPNGINRVFKGRINSSVATDQHRRRKSLGHR
ncbi:uncharacterized protein sS8_3166 [Methylocaldum marinum]|uniref:Uncharacterized protein n=1 Tax=Methylocaldum marinum TaxID=1432792 RepID=A0A250KZ97_9GAMM|nr:uncharacterized protein sS8_3166 [Methylocaldum marinum]